MSASTRVVEVELTAVEEQLLESVQAFHGHGSEAETVGFLVRQEAQRLVQGGQTLWTMQDVVDGYLRGVVTAQEAMQVISSQ